MSDKKEYADYADFEKWIVGVDMSAATDRVIKSVFYGEHKRQTTFDLEMFTPNPTPVLIHPQLTTMWYENS